MKNHNPSSIAVVAGAVTLSNSKVVKDRLGKNLFKRRKDLKKDAVLAIGAVESITNSAK